MKALKLVVALCVVCSFSAGAFAGSCCDAAKKKDAALGADCGKDGKKGSDKDKNSSSTVSLSAAADKKA